MEKLLKKYENGDFTVYIYSLGSRVLEPHGDNPKMSFPNCMDVCITKYCDNNCPFCYNDSTTKKGHADVESFKKLIGTFKGGEIAIGGGDAFTHPDLEEMLRFCKDRDIFVSMTINQNHLKRHKDAILRYFKEDLIKSIGISMTNPATWDEEIYQEIANAKEEGVTIHVIAGLIDMTYFPVLKGKKILILGYKSLGRAKDTHPVTNIEWLRYIWLPVLRYKCKKIIFDNLAIDQLHIKEYFNDEDWNIVYQGDDGDGTMYLDLVDKWYGISSIVEDDKKIPLTESTIEELYAKM